MRVELSSVVKLSTSASSKVFFLARKDKGYKPQFSVYPILFKSDWTVPGNFPKGALAEFLCYDRRFRCVGVLATEWFEKRKSSNIFVYLFPSKGITIDRSKLRIKLSENENWLSPNELDSGGFWGSHAISFKVQNDIPPDLMIIEIAGVMLDGIHQDIKQIEFKRSRSWSYSPIVIPVNSDFKPIRAENLPCN